MRAIVLSAVPYADHSFMVALLTRDEGMVTVSVRSGGRNSRFRRSYLAPLTRLEVELQGRPSREVRYVADVSAAAVNAGLMNDREKLLASQFVAEVLSHALRYQAEDAKIYDSIEREVVDFDQTPIPVDDWLVGFLFRLMRLSGIEPNVWEWREGLMLDGYEGRMTDICRPYASLSIPLSRALFRYLSEPDYRLTQAESRTLIYFSLDFFKMHLEGFGSVKSVSLLGY